MIDLNSILALFEEIKQLILDLIKLVGKRESTPVSTNIDEINSIKEEVVNSNNAVIETLERIEESINQPRTEKKHIVHSINPKSLGFVIPFVLLLIFLVTTLFFTYELKQVNNRMVYNDLKYRYIKMIGEIDSTDLFKLEKLFNKNTDQKLIDDINKIVSDYEDAIKKQLIYIEKARLKEEFSESLKQKFKNINNRNSNN